MPTIVAIVGLPTSGKTTLACALAQATNLHLIDIDQGPVSCAPPQETDPLRSEESRLRERARMAIAYDVLHAAVKANIAQGFSVLITATYSQYARQDILQKIAEQQTGTVLKIIWCRYNDTSEEVDRRIADRIERGALGGVRSASHYFTDKERYHGIKLPHITVLMEGGEQGTQKALQEALAYVKT